MSTQTATMSDPFSSLVYAAGFIRKLVVLLFFVAGIVALMALFDFYQKTLPDILMMVFAVTSIGLSVGIGARTVFYENSGSFRTIVVLLLLPLALFALGFFTNWRMGIGPLEPWLNGLVDWSQVAQLAGGFFVVILSMTAWWRPVGDSEDMLPRARRSASRREHSSAASYPQLPRFKLPRLNPPRLHLPESWTRPRGNSHLRLNHRSRSTGRNHNQPDAGRLVVARPERPVRPKRRRGLRRKPELQFSVYEEHRCPYCLDLVKRNDPRGVKECEVCHSWHHADCWNITGMCQVPHLNT
jgi:hypothetical protein